MPRTTKTNSDRATDAATAIEAHSLAMGINEESNFTQVSDLMCNLSHYCEQNGIGWDHVLQCAMVHAESEIEFENKEA